VIDLTLIHKKILFGAFGIAFLTGTALRHANAQMSADAPPVQGQNPNGMHIFMWGGLKSHGEGAHDYPIFFSEWSKVLTDHGAVVDGALHPPNATDLEHTDVLLIYKGDAGYLSDNQKTIFENYVKRGGGIVSIHDSLCGPDPAWFAQTLTGGAKKHGEQNSQQDPQMHYEIGDRQDPILKDWGDLTFPDEAFFLMTWAKDPAIHVLGTTSPLCGPLPAIVAEASRCGPTSTRCRAGSRRARLSGCRATHTQISRTPSSRKCCSAESRGRETSPSTSWRATYRHPPDAVAAVDAAAEARLVSNRGRPLSAPAGFY
jgi:hypothetical protein